MDEPQHHHNNKEKDTTPIVIKNASFKWDENDASPLLLNISLEINSKKLVAVVGKVGSGKSSLLSAILGEMHKVEGDASLNGSVAYVPQQAWILNATVRNNILFGTEMQQNRYKKVIYSCALEPDLAILSGKH